jgi:hypothetical protein
MILDPDLKSQISGSTSWRIPIQWQAVEALQGNFDFACVDGLVAGARNNNLRLILTWFGQNYFSELPEDILIAKCSFNVDDESL